MAMCQVMGYSGYGTPVRQSTMLTMPQAATVSSLQSVPGVPPVQLAPFPSGCLEATRSFSPRAAPAPMGARQVMQMPVRQCSTASLGSGKVTGPNTPIHTGRGLRPAGVAPPPAPPLLAAQALEIDHLKKELEESRSNERRLQEELEAAKAEVQRLAEALEQEKQLRMEMDVPREVPKATKGGEPVRMKSDSLKRRVAEHLESEPDILKAPLSQRAGLKRGMSPIIRRPSRDEVEEKLSEYLATSPHCKLEFCRLNQGWLHGPVCCKAQGKSQKTQEIALRCLIWRLETIKLEFGEGSLDCTQIVHHL
ncbi:unnamed protein product [Durusdinium trenchii]|uniref:Uncharacterized protein n=1 Tax=Durusdinium trenchii TaxID=1381693 RepID=A0ABP0LYY5_9DINO